MNLGLICRVGGTVLCGVAFVVALTKGDGAVVLFVTGGSAVGLLGTLVP